MQPASPQAFPTPPPPQVKGLEQAPQLALREVPQLSDAVTKSQFFPSREQNAGSPSGVQPHTLEAPPPPHVCGRSQAPQFVLLKVAQLSAAVTRPQVSPRRLQKAGFVSAAQPHSLGVPPPPQVCGA